ncbi:MAG: pilus assembly protein TadG [Pseudomonadota bacterium]|nr:pilus assembly protein TadG [Pseudomonadota bacterium]
MFVFMLGLLMLFVGGAVDFTRYNTIRADLIESMDAAGLAMAQIDALNGPEIRDLSPSAREEYLKEQGRKFFYENFKHASLVNDLNIDFDLSASTIIPKATGSVKTLFLGIGQMLQVGSSTNNGSLSKLNLSSETEIVRRDDGNIEVAMVMDLTGSMGGSKIADLRTAAKEMVDIVVRDDQSEWYSKVALVPYSIGVNVGSYANSVRGAIPGPKAITNAVWKVGTAKDITNVEKLNPVKITTSGSHGFSNGDTVWIDGVQRSGGSGSCKFDCQINSKVYTVSNATSTTFTLQGVNGTSWSGNYSSSSSDFATKCVAANCEVRVTAASHGFSTNDYVHINGVVGMTEINNSVTNGSTSDDFWRITKVDNDNFTLNGSVGPTYSAYSSGGSTWCSNLGCEYYRVTDAGGTVRGLKSSTCVSERLGTDKYTDTAPSTSKVGWNYPFSTSSGSNSSCTASQIVPLSTNKVALKTSIDGYNAVGYTAGHIGVAWGWYMLSPNFGYLWPAESAPGAYDDDELTKVAVIMTDGEFNTQYCKGAVSKDSSGPGSTARINCNSENGNGFDQAEDMCDAMKDAGVLIYTIGFDVGSNTNVQDLMTNCASGPDYVYFAATGEELKDIYRAIGSEISKLHISK